MQEERGAMRRKEKARKRRDRKERKKGTFWDPRTEERIPSTWLARFAGAMGFGLTGLVHVLWENEGRFDKLMDRPVGCLAQALGVGLICGVGLLFLGKTSMGIGLLVSVGVGWLVFGLVFGWLGRADEIRRKVLFRLLHDGIARQQYRQDLQRKQKEEARKRMEEEKQRIEEEWAGVPDGALSPAEPPGEPEATATSLSLAREPEEEKPRLGANAVESNPGEAGQEPLSGPHP